MVDREALAWAAGFFDGEGYAGTLVAVNAPRFVLTVTQYERTTLERFHATVSNLGHVYTALTPNANGTVRSRWTAQRFEEAQAVVALLWPWLSDPKRGQITEAMKRFHCLRGTMPRRSPRMKAVVGG